MPRRRRRGLPRTLGRSESHRRKLRWMKGCRGADGELGAGEDGGLSAELLEDLSGTSQTITGLTNAAVNHDLLDDNLAHGVSGLLAISNHF